MKIIKKALFKYGKNIRRSYLFNGQRFWVTNRDIGMSKDIFVNHIREENALKYFLECIKPQDIVLDLGANMGFYVLQEALICKQVIAVEPSKLNYTFLNLNVFDNNLKNINSHELAIGTHNGIIDFNVSNAGNLSSIIQRDKSHKYHVEKVELMTGFDFLNKFNYKANVLRMDIEGYELEALKSFKDKLKDFDSIFLEVHKGYLKEQELELFKLFSENGFDNFWYIPDEKKYGKFNKKIINLKGLVRLEREEVYHLFCFRGYL